MNVVGPPSSQPGDDLEGLLRAFLRSQLPQPWPAPRLPTATVSGERQPLNRWGLMRSRWALAASVALLFFGSWILPSSFTPKAKPGHGPTGPMISNIPADAPKEHRRRKQVGNKNKPGLAADEGEQGPELEDPDLPMFR